MTLRACLAVIAAATPLLMAASEVTAAPGVGYSAQDKATIETCIETAQRNAQRANVCIGTAAQACESLPEMASTMGMRDCYERENAYWDEMLNDRYQKLLVNFSKTNAEKLRAMQRTWIAWRTQKCEMPYMLFEGGSMAGPMAAYCVMETTGERALELDQALIAP